MITISLEVWILFCGCLKDFQNIYMKPSYKKKNFKVFKELFSIIEINEFSKGNWIFLCNKGLLNSQGPLWLEQRRFALHTLKDFGFGKIGAERVISNEVQLLVEYLRHECEKTSGKSLPMNPRISITKAIANVICVLVFGERLGDEKEFDEMSKIINEIVIPAFDQPAIVIALAKYDSKQILSVKDIFQVLFGPI